MSATVRRRYKRYGDQSGVLRSFYVYGNFFVGLWRVTREPGTIARPISPGF